ncbi:MAG: hypothetical protein V1725_02015 [archaeon]
MKKTLLTLLLILLVINLTQTMLITLLTPEPAPTARLATSLVKLCINHPPEINNTCNATMEEHELYTCTVLAIDDEPVTFSSVWMTNISQFFNLTSTGLINTTPGITDAGNHTIRIYAMDNLSCTNSVTFEDFTFEVVSINDPPYLLRPLPNVSLNVNTSIVAFLLNDYFADPEDDALTYTYTGGSGFSISIDDESGVLISTNACDAGSVIFTAIEVNTSDSYTANSNSVTLSVNCPASSSSAAGAGTGGGTGGGGASESCTPDWKCRPWSACFENSTHYKECYDANACDENHYEHTVWANCTYIAGYTCLENWTCTPWTNCTPNNIHTRACTDNNTCGTDLLRPNETEPCTYIPTCFDGIQNQGELGKDCGGPCSRVCPKDELPTFIKEKSPLTLVLSLFIFIIIALLLVFKFFRKQIYDAGTLLVWAATEKVLLPPKLPRELAVSWLAELDTIEQQLGKKDIPLRIPNVFRRVLVKLVGITPEATVQDLQLLLKKQKLPELFADYLKTTFISITALEFAKEKPTTETLVLAIEEARQCITFLSDVPRQAVPEERQHTFVGNLTYAFALLRIKNVAGAKERYRRLLQQYDLLPLSRKEALYPELNRLFLAVSLAIKGVRKQ